MKLAIFNGSPREKGSNTKILLEHFCKGFESSGGEVQSLDYLINYKNIKEQVDNFKKAENVFFAFPLYTDSMPGIVKNFIETINTFDGSEKKIFFLVQSGFPEGIHSVFVEKYLRFLAKEWNFEYSGTIIKPGVEGIQIMPESWTKKIFKKMSEFGKDVAESGKPDTIRMKKFAKPYKLPKSRLLLLRLLRFIGITNFYWNSNLKKNKAYKKRFEAPFLK